MAVPAVLSLVTLGVADVRASTRFYEQLGFPLSSSSVQGEMSFFRTTGGLLAVWGTDDLRADAGVEATASTGAYREFSLAINVASRADVDAGLASAEAAGARIIRPAEATDWGGYNGYFADPDGHLWEIAHNPFWPLGPDGMAHLPD